jgi:hypothetical protein
MMTPQTAAEALQAYRDFVPKFPSTKPTRTIWSPALPEAERAKMESAMARLSRDRVTFDVIPQRSGPNYRDSTLTSNRRRREVAPLPPLVVHHHITIGSGKVTRRTTYGAA